MFKNNSKYIKATENNFTIINSDVEYASQIINSIPVGYIDKTICGCGFTTVALENNENIIIAMPTKLLVNNKVKQYPNKRFKSNIFGVYGGINLKNIFNYVDDCIEENKPIKIAVTYDSLYKVESLLNTKSYNFKLIIDESDKLLQYAHLKVRDKKLNDISVIDYLWNTAKQHKNTTSFISATPIPLIRLPQWISELHQYKFEWNNTIPFTPNLIKTEQPIKILKQHLIKSIKIKQYALLEDGTKIKKLIIFINSVSKIMKIIDDTNLHSREVAIICADHKYNNDLIKGFNRLKKYDKLPTFTFVTSTGFQGIDLDDEEALSVVLSMTSQNHTMIDINFDMKQAMSRNRNKSNQFYGECLFIYNQSIFEKSENELIEILDNKRIELSNAILGVSKIKNKTEYDSVMKYIGQSKEFVTYVKNENGVLSINENIFNADIHFILSTRRSFSSGFQIQSNNTYRKSKSLVKASFPDYVEYAEHFKKNKKWEKAFYNNKYKDIITQNYERYNKVWINYTTATAQNNKKKISKRVNSIIVKQVKQKSIKYKKFIIIELTQAKQIVKTVFVENNINEAPKGAYIISLFDDIKKSTIKINGKVVSVYKIRV